eukprot:666892-Prymnesium_polylepis.1
MLRSLEPDTILVPSGEKATELTERLCALGSSATYARLEASATHAQNARASAKTSNHTVPLGDTQLGPGKLTPQFDTSVVIRRHNLGAIW